MEKIKALFLDRDGTINVDYGYVGSVDKFEFIDGIFSFCKKAQEKGYLIIVITNQSGIARGYYTVADYDKVTRYMCDEFMKRGITITDVFYCPELSGSRRKPEPEMFLEAQRKYNIDMSKSISIGDKDRDIEAGRKADVGKNLLYTGNNFNQLMEEL